MIWFIKKYIFSNIVMKTVHYDLSKLPDQEPPTDVIIDGNQLDCRIIQALDIEMTSMLEQAFARMDAKQSFSISDIHKRLSAGYVFSVGIIQDHVVGWTWGAINKVYFSDFNCTINLEEKVAFSYNTFIDKDYRGKKINNYILNNILLYFKQKHYKKIWCLIYPWNIASIKSYTNNGWKLTGDYRFIKLFGMNFHFPKGL